MRFFFMIQIFLLCTSLVEAGELFRLEGKLLEKGTRKPLGGANVFILPHKIKATSTPDGSFVLENVPEGKVQWVVNQAGYEKLQADDEITEDNASQVWTLYLEKVSYLSYETTVTGKQKKRDDSTRTLKREIFTQLPGSGGDPIKAVQNLPGVNRAQGFSSQVIIQGSSPQDTRYMIDGHEVPIIFHFGGLSSVVLPDAIDRVDYLSAGYGPEYSRAMGGLVGVWTKQPRKDRWGGFGFVDLLNTGALVEGPVGEKGSVMIGARQSYVGEVLKQVAKASKDFNLTVAPTFGDTVFAYDGEITERDHLKVVSVASRDRLQFVLSSPLNQDPSVRGTFDNRTAFFRIIPQVTHKHSEIATSRLSIGMGKDWTRFDIGQDYFYLSNYALTTRGETERKFSPHYTSQVGFDNRFNWAKVDVSLPQFVNRGGVSNPLSSGVRRQANINRSSNSVGVFWRNEWKPASDGPWTLLPNARVDYFGLTNEALPAPRLAIRYQWDDSLFFKAAGGLYYQPPQEQNVDETFGNPDVKAPHAWHGALGAEKDFREGSSHGFIVTGGGFYRHFGDLIISSSKTTTRNGVIVPENFNNDGSGRAFGAETQIRLEAKPWNGWISYTVSRSTRWSKADTVERLFNSDQTHLLTALAGVDLGRNWRISTRFRYVTGNPQTPVTGAVFDSDSDTYIPIRGALFSTRLQPFMQWDIRIDKKWIFNRWILSLYLDVQNATNRANPEAVRYSYDYGETAVVSGLPIFPTFGVKGEF